MTEPTSSGRPALLVLASTYPRWPGDPEPGFVHELSRRLVPRFEVTVLCPAARGAKPEEDMDGVRVVRYRYAPASLQTLVNDGGIVTNLKRRPWKWLLLPGFFLGQALAVWRLLRRTRPAVVHAHWLIPQGLVLAALGLVLRAMPPFVVTSHGADLYSLRARPFRWLKRFTARRAAIVTVVSRGMREAMAELVDDPAAIRVEPMGVDLVHRFRVDPGDVRSGDRLLFVGRLVAKKGLGHLVEALPIIISERPDVRLDIVGFGPEEAGLRARCRALGLDDHVRFLGALGQSDIPPLYRCAAVFVAPFVQAPDGDQEGLGLVLVEAAGCGCPVVAGDVPAVHDVVRAPEIGEVVRADDTVALSRAVLAALDARQRSPDRVEARARGVSHFDWAVRARAYAELLAAAAGATGSARGAGQEP